MTALFGGTGARAAGCDVASSRRPRCGCGGNHFPLDRAVGLEGKTAAPAERVLPGIDCTGVPMAAREVEGVAGKQADGAAKTREAKAVVCREADSLDPKTGEPRKDCNSGAVGVRIDSAQAVNGAGRASEFAACLEQFAHRNGVLAAEEVAVLSDGKREAWMERVRKQLDAGRVDLIVAALKRHRRFKAVAACIRTCEANMDRMRCDLYRRRGLPVGSGIVESACKRIVGSRLKGAGRHWSKAGADAVLAIGRCLENRRWPDFLDWRDCSAAAA